MPGTRATLGLEWSLSLAACSALPQGEKETRLRPLLHESINWKVLFEIAGHHGVQPLLEQAMSCVEEAIPQSVLLTLRQLHQANVYKSLFLSLELLRVLDVLFPLNIEVLPYKGLALAEMAYGDIALRQSGDIDLLIHAKDLPRIREAVAQLGYTPHTSFSPAEERAYLKSGYECAFDTATSRNLLEVQWAIQPRFYTVDFDMEGLFRRSVAITVAGRAMRTPSPEDLFLILSLHAAKHVWDRLIWLCDIARIMNRADLDWSLIGSQARRLAIVRILRVTMILANHLLDAAIPSAAETHLPRDSGAIELASLIESRLASGVAYNSESFSYFRLMMQLRERPIDRMRFLSRLAFTPGPGEWQAVRIPAPLFPLYRLIRLSRLTVRLIRSS